MAWSGRCRVISAGGVLVTAQMAQALAESAGVCIRPLLRKVTDRATGTVTSVPIPCGSTRDSRCPACAVKAKRLRMHQCREGWHLTADPIPAPPALDDDKDQAGDEQAADEDGAAGAGDADGTGAEDVARRARSTRRARDAPDLPRVDMDARTTGQGFTDPKTGRTYQPSMFVTLTLGSYGRIVPGRGVPADPGSYDYRRAALDALHFPKVVDRWMQNLRRCAGYKVQYFAAVEPQKRLAPHLHAALRGAIPRATIKAVTRATYANVWWPAHEHPVYTDRDRAPIWDPAEGCYRCPDTGRPLRTWQEALDDLDADLVADPSMKPAHTVRLGSQVDVKGLLGGTEDSDRAVRYLCKYLTKAVADTYAGDEPDAAYEAHINLLHAEVAVLPCSPECANWLRYGIQPKDAGPGLAPGRCPKKAHDRECLGLGGRRCLVSRAWTGKTLTVHKADRADVVRQVLEAAGIEPPQARRAAADVLHTDGRPRYVWEDVPPTERDYAQVIVASITEQRRWRAQHDHAKTHAAQCGSPPGVPVDNRSASDHELQSIGGGHSA